MPDQAAPAVNSDMSIDLRRALAALPVRQRATLVLRHWEDLPVHEVAALLRGSEGTAAQSRTGVSTTPAALSAGYSLGPVLS